MASNTIYPYGPGGTLPSGIGIINDLTTGGADKSLSAQMGKLLNNKIEGYGEVGDIVDIDTSALVSCGGSISQGVWQTNANYYGALIPVAEYRDQSVSILGHATNNTAYAFLVDGNTGAGTTVKYATGWSKTITIPANTIVEDTIPSDAVYLYVYLNSNGTSYRPQSIQITIDKKTGGLVQEIEKINDFLRNADENILIRNQYNLSNLSDGPTISSSTGKWVSESGYYAGIIDVRGYRSKGVSIVANSSHRASYTFLKSGPTIGQIAQYATGYSGVLYVTAGQTVQVAIPSDAAYLYVYKESNGTIYTPSAIYFIDSLQHALANKGIEDYLVLFSYNIGHFALGVQKNSTITAAQYPTKVDGFRALLSNKNPDIYGIVEYSEIFGKNASGVDVYAKDELFNFERTRFESSQMNYACYALFGGERAPLYNVQINDFECLKNESVSQSGITAQDYRYISANLYAFGVSIKLVVTHLAFDSSRPGVLQDYQIEELIEKYGDEDYVIMMGDWNCSNQSHFDAFVEAGYSLANDGSFITYPSGASALDNIVVKGLEISDVEMVNNSLSDHYPLICKITPN